MMYGRGQIDVYKRQAYTYCVIDNPEVIVVKRKTDRPTTSDPYSLSALHSAGGWACAVAADIHTVRW